MRQRVYIGLVVPVFCVCLAACSSPEGAGDPENRNAAPMAVSAPVVSSLEGWNLVVIVVDSLRADHLGCYGYDRPTSPFIDSLARQGLLFERASASSSFIAQSLSALFSGRLPTSGGTIGLLEAHPLDETTTLPQFFGRAGYYTGIVSNQPLIRGRGFTKGFEDVQIGTMEAGWSGMDISQRAVEFVEDAGDDPFFLYLHYLDPHHPYTPPEPFRGRFVAAGDEVLDVAAFRRDYASEMEALDGPDDPRAQALVALYDAEIAYTDACIAKFVRGLEGQDKLDTTAIVVTSNHGEEFLEHGYIGNAWTLYNEVLAVPLIVRAPGAVPTGRVQERVSLADLPPTLLGVFEIDRRNAPMDGEALFAEGPDGFRFTSPRKPQIAELILHERAVVRAVTLGDWKYVAASLWEPQETRYEIGAAFAEIRGGMSQGSLPMPPLWGSDAFEALFDLQRDPGETINLASQEQDRLRLLRQALAAYQSECEQLGLGPRPLAGVLDVLDPEDIEDLEALGYL